jgi:hypothetical protein
MPALDGREWLTPRKIVEDFQWLRFYDEFKDEPWFDHPGDPYDASPFKERWVQAGVRGFLLTGYQDELKRSRLLEMLKDALLSGRHPRPDQAETFEDAKVAWLIIMEKLRMLFRRELLDAVDDDGNPLEPL